MHRFIHQMKSLIPKQILHNLFFWSDNIITFIKLNLRKFSWLYQNRTKWNKLEAQIEGCKIAGCGLRVAGHRLHCGLWVGGHRLRVAGHTQVVGCGPQISGCGLRATLGLRAAGHRLRAVGPCCGLLKLLVAKLQVAKMSCCGLLNCGLRFARLSRLGGCQLLDLSGYNMGYRPGGATRMSRGVSGSSKNSRN